MPNSQVEYQKPDPHTFTVMWPSENLLLSLLVGICLLNTWLVGVQNILSNRLPTKTILKTSFLKTYSPKNLILVHFCCVFKQF